MGNILVIDKGWGGMKWEGDEFCCKMSTWGDPWGDGNVLYLDCINANIPAVILYCSSATCYHWGKQGKDLFVLFLMYMCTDIYLKIKSLTKSVLIKLCNWLTHVHHIVYSSLYTWNILNNNFKIYSKSCEVCSEFGGVEGYAATKTNFHLWLLSESAPFKHNGYSSYMSVVG